MEYFSHDYKARHDRKLVNLLMKKGAEGIGIFWCIIEMLYEDGGRINTSEYERITFELRSNYDTVKSVIEDFKLFKIDGEHFYSESVLGRLKQRSDKSAKARESISKRWKNSTDTNVIRTYTKRNTIKERKGKERVIDRTHLFRDSKWFDKPLFSQTLKAAPHPYNIVNPESYYEKALNWSDSKSNKKVDWMATIKNWIRSDFEKGLITPQLKKEDHTMRENFFNT
jgi:hypothetical protein